MAEKKNSSPITPPDRDASLFSIDKIRSGTTGNLATKILMGFLVVVFAVGFLFLNPGMFGGGNGAPQPVDTGTAVATLGTQSITQGQSMQAEQQQEQMMQQYGITIGTNELLGTDPAAIAPAMERLFAGKWKQGGLPPLWDGKAAERIVEYMMDFIEAESNS